MNLEARMPGRDETETVALGCLRRIYEAVPEEARPRLENDLLELARALTGGMSAQDVGTELAWLEAEIRERRGFVLET